MSFFQNSLQSYLATQPYFIPVFPYIVHFPQKQTSSTNLQNNSFSLLKQEIKASELPNIDNITGQSKINYSKHKQKQPKVQEQIILRVNNPRLETQQNDFSKKSYRKTGKKKKSNEKKVQDDFIQKYNNNLDKTKKNKNQEEYQPFQKRKKSSIFIRDNQNRNIIPNEVNQILSYVQKSSKSKLIVERIFKKYPPSNLEYSVKRFYIYQSLLKQRVSNYINQNSLTLVKQIYEAIFEVYSLEQQLYYNKVCRVLIHHFLQEDSIFNILTSRRMHTQKKRKHLEMRRELKGKVLEILKH